ncbi:MAG: alkaline phosphatase family protein [Acidobacteriia bacterium]|nr:alkaline phosphatase family protein [Terriglobia bacterium]
MKKKAVVLCLLATLTGVALAGDSSKDVPKLDRVFLIMMENHGYGQILNNPNAPYVNALAKTGNLATNYFAIAHPSLTNYLEVAGGSNFGVLSDNDPDFHNSTCIPNLASGVADTDNPPSPNICPIAGTGTDAETPAVDLTNETQGPPGLNNIDGILHIPAASGIVGQTIGDQLVAAGKTWKSYQQSLPLVGPDLVTYSDGVFTNLTDFSMLNPQLDPPLTQADVVKLYAAKHNPFVYFQNVQEGTNPLNSFANVVDFDGPNGLYADLRSGKVPNFLFIAPNQCNDQHGRSNAGAFCNFDPGTDGTQATLNPALILMGDQTVQRIVTAIQASSVWTKGHNAIVVMWDENDYSVAPNINQVVLIVDTNYGFHNLTSGVYYNHFSLLKTLDQGFRLPCLNHACDANVSAMSDLFGQP